MTKSEMLLRLSMEHGGRIPAMYRVVETHAKQIKEWLSLVNQGKSFDEAFIRAFKMEDADLLLLATVRVIYNANGLYEGVHFDILKEHFVDWVKINHYGREVSIIDANISFKEWYGEKPTLMRGIGYWRFFSWFVWHLFRDEAFRNWCHEYIRA